MNYWTRPDPTPDYEPWDEEPEMKSVQIWIDGSPSVQYTVALGFSFREQEVDDICFALMKQKFFIEAQGYKIEGFGWFIAITMDRYMTPEKVVEMVFEAASSIFGDGITLINEVAGR